MIPVVEILLCVFDDLQFLFRIVDECAELAFLSLAQLIAENLIYFSLDVARSIFQHMLERLILTVYVGKEMLCALG